MDCVRNFQVILLRSKQLFVLFQLIDFSLHRFQQPQVVRCLLVGQLCRLRLRGEGQCAEQHHIYRQGRESQGVSPRERTHRQSDFSGVSPLIAYQLGGYWSRDLSNFFES